MIFFVKERLAEIASYLINILFLSKANVYLSMQDLKKYAKDINQLEVQNYIQVEKVG